MATRRVSAQQLNIATRGDLRLQDIQRRLINIYEDKDGYTLVTLPRIVTPYHDSEDGTRDRVSYQKLVTR